MRKSFRCTAIVLTALLLSQLAPLPFHGSDVFGARDWGGDQWRLEGRRHYVGEKGGSWRIGIRARASGESGDTIQMGTSKSVSNSVSGTCGISRSKLNAAFQFNVNRTWSVNASKSYSLSKKKKGSWWAIKYKPIHRRYKHKARKYTFIDGKWRKTGKTKWIYAKRFDHFAYKLTKANSVR